MGFLLATRQACAATVSQDQSTSRLALMAALHHPQAFGQHFAVEQRDVAASVLGVRR